jgi:hypothetical protein
LPEVQRFAPEMLPARKRAALSRRYGDAWRKINQKTTAIKHDGEDDEEF